MQDTSAVMEDKIKGTQTSRIEIIREWVSKIQQRKTHVEVFCQLV